MEALYVVAWLAFRAFYSFVFLNAAWQCGKNRAGIEWTIAESRILFGNAAPIFGPAGILVMGLGGVSILLGFCAEIAGVSLLLFLPMGAVIHFRQRKRAVSLGESSKASMSAGNMEVVTELTTLAALGHYSSAIKNWSLIGPAIFLSVIGSGPYSLMHAWGLGLH